MAYENIQVQDNNFCIGPQAGTFCSADVDANLMHLKTTTASLIRSYAFSPSGVIADNPIVELQYSGPINIDDVYDGLPFYTLERISDSQCKIRRWTVNSSLTQLDLQETITKTGSIYDCNTFDFQTIVMSLDNHVTTGTGEIEVTTTSGIEKYDKILLGPSSDVDNDGAVEYVWVNNVIDDTTLEVRTDGGAIPTAFEYVQGDSVIVFKYIFLFSDISSSNGRIYKLDTNNYGAVLDTQDSPVYNGVSACKWNQQYNGLSFVQDSNMLTTSVVDYEILKSQFLWNYKADKKNKNTIYSIDFDQYTIYRLQSGTTRKDDNGAFADYAWTTYNYQQDTILPYSSNISLVISPERELIQDQRIKLTATVRDQFGVTLSNKNVQFYKDGDTGATFDPITPQGITDSNGQFAVDYISGTSYNGNSNLSVRVDGGSTNTGSQYAWCYSVINTNSDMGKVVKPIQVKYVINEGRVVQVEEVVDYSGPLLKCFSKFRFPGGHFVGNNPSGNTTFALVKQEQLPLLHTGSPIPDSDVKLLQINAMWEPERSNQQSRLTQKLKIDNDFQMSQTYISRHHSTGHQDSVEIDQFIFVQEARPVFWSEKNPINTDIWLRLRPFAFSLDPTSLTVKIREESYVGNESWRDITSEGTITLFDAGASLDGLEFQWYLPSETYFHHNGIVYVQVEVYDLSATPNRIYVDYWFRLIQDYKKPYIENISPEREAFDVTVDTSISFDIMDAGAGVAIDSLEMFVNYKKVYPDVTKTSNKEYHVSYTPTNNFIFSDDVIVTVSVQDSSEIENKLVDSWRFYIVESASPWFDVSSYKPGLCNFGVDRKNRDISFQVYGIGDGLDVQSLEVYIGGRYRKISINPIVYRLN